MRRVTERQHQHTLEAEVPGCHDHYDLRFDALACKEERAHTLWQLGACSPRPRVLSAGGSERARADP